MEPLTAGLIAAAPKLLGGLFSAFAPKPRQPLPMAPSLMGGQRFQPAQEEPRQGPTPGQLILDGILSGGLEAFGTYAQQPTVDDAAKITGEQTSLLAPKGTVSPGTLGIDPLLRSNAAAIELMGQPQVATHQLFMGPPQFPIPTVGRAATYLPTPGELDEYDMFDGLHSLGRRLRRK